MPATITTEELRKAKCQECGDTDPNCVLVLGSKCHPKAGVKAVYEKSAHRLRLTCSVCDKLVIYIQFPDLS